MKSKLSTLQRRWRSRGEEGFTLIEMVVAIPIAFLILGLVVASAGVTVSLMGQVTNSAGAAKAATVAMDQLSEARNCAEVKYIADRQSVPAADSKFKLNFTYTCSKGTSFPLTVDVKENGGDKVLFTKKLTLAAM